MVFTWGSEKLWELLDPFDLDLSQRIFHWTLTMLSISNFVIIMYFPIWIEQERFKRGEKGSIGDGTACYYRFSELLNMNSVDWSLVTWTVSTSHVNLDVLPFYGINKIIRDGTCAYRFLRTWTLQINWFPALNLSFFQTRRGLGFAMDLRRASTRYTRFGTGSSVSLPFGICLLRPDWDPCENS